MVSKYKLKSFISVIAILSMVLTACSSKPVPDTGNQVQDNPKTASTPKASEKPGKKQIVVGLEAEPTTLDAQQLTDYNSSRATMDIYDQLVRFKDESTEVEPDLAKSWDISKDGLEYTFYLRKGVKFHDGTPFNAEAVKFSFERQIDPKHPYHNTGQFAAANFVFGSVKSIKVVDNYTIKITLKEPFAPFINNLGMHAASIVSPAAVKKYGKDFSKHPVGTGPFKFVKWDPGVEVVLEKNNDYYNGAPKIDKLIFKPIKDAQTRLAELESGNIDLVVNVPPDDLSRLKKDNKLQVIEQAGMHDWYIPLNTQKKPFNDVRVRQAVNYAINKKAIVDGLLKGTAELANSPIPPTIWGLNEKVRNYEYNPEKAKQLLAEAGYPNGFKVEFWVPESGSGMQQPQVMAAAIQADLQKVGIKANIKTFEWGTYLSKVFAPLKETNMDMHEMSWIGDNGDPDNFLYVLLSGDSWPKNGFNDAYYKNEEVDKLLRKARVTLDKEQRVKMYKQAQTLIMKDAPWVLVDHSKQIVVASKRIKNFKLHPTGVFRFSNVDIK